MQGILAESVVHRGGWSKKLCTQLSPSGLDYSLAVSVFDHCKHLPLRADTSAVLPPLVSCICSCSQSMTGAEVTAAPILTSLASMARQRWLMLLGGRAAPLWACTVMGSWAPMWSMAAWGGRSRASAACQMPSLACLLHLVSALHS
jgi:hypothetical protein